MDVKLRTLLIFGILPHIFGWRPFIVIFSNGSYELFHPEIVDVNVTIRNRSFIDAQLNIERDISQMFVDFVVAHDSGNGNYNMVYMNRTVDLCMLLNNRKSNAFFDIIYRIVSDYVDLPKKCPIRKCGPYCIRQRQKRYELQNVYLDPDKFPPFMPDHRAKVSAVAWNNHKGKKNILVKFRIYIEIERSFKNNGN